MPSPALALLSTGIATGAPHIPTHFDAASLSSTSPGGANYDDVNEAEVLMLPRVLMTFLQVFCPFTGGRRVVCKDWWGQEQAWLSDPPSM